MKLLQLLLLVQKKNDEKHRMKFETICTNEAGKVVIKGEALVMKK